MQRVCSPKAWPSKTCKTCFPITGSAAGFLRMWWESHVKYKNKNTICKIEVEREMAARYVLNPCFIISTSREQLSHTYTDQTMLCFPHWLRTENARSFCLLHWSWPHLIGLLLRGKLIFCYYFSCVWCKIAHYISRTELLCLANWKGKVITPWIYTASSFVVLRMDLIKQNNTHSRDVPILMGDGNK